jgi:hypothetical protein
MRKAFALFAGKSLAIIGMQINEASVPKDFLYFWGKQT